MKIEDLGGYLMFGTIGWILFQIASFYLIEPMENYERGYLDGVNMVLDCSIQSYDENGESLTDCTRRRLAK